MRNRPQSSRKHGPGHHRRDHPLHKQAIRRTQPLSFPKRISQSLSEAKERQKVLKVPKKMTLGIHPDKH